MAGIEFYFAPFDTSHFNKESVVFGFGFESQEDPELSRQFPELESRRQSFDKIEEKDSEFITLQAVVREGEIYQVGLIYVQYPWKRKKEIMVGGVNFLRSIFSVVKLATERAKEEKYEKMIVLLPDRFSPRNV